MYEVGRVSPGSPSQEFESHLGKQGLGYAFVISNLYSSVLFFY